MPEDHPLAEEVGLSINGFPLCYNDIFRAVHDYYGHAKEGYRFDARGEENAWRQHSKMYTDIARPAMSAETRGQNSWVNFGPHMRAKDSGKFLEPNEEGFLSITQRPFAQQKATILPEELLSTAKKSIRLNYKSAINNKKQLREMFYGKIYYHISPEANINNFKGSYSPTLKQKGLFVCPKFYSLVNDWLSYVLRKKGSLYQGLTIYKLYIPKNIIDESIEEMEQKANEAWESDNYSFGFWNWGLQIFISEEYLDQVKIVGKKTYTKNKYWI